MAELLVSAFETDNGFGIRLRGRVYKTRYPGKAWKAAPKDVRTALKENLSFGATHFLPLILGSEKISYDFPCPSLESHLFRNQLGDMLVCEKADGVPHLDYLRRFYNLGLRFAAGSGAISTSAPRIRGETAILPFTFGKESLVTLGLCLELGIKPVLMYSEEPVQPYEGAYKRRLLRRFSEELGISTHFVGNDLGLFRNDRAFGKKPGTELGWGSQTTLLCLMALPFVYLHGAKYILIGSEFGNNEYQIKNDWKVFLSYDQTSFWTQQQRNLVRSLTGARTGVYASLEPIEEVNIFSMLHHRYPELGRFQFSCAAEKPLVAGSQWCHKCYKCARMFLFARACDVDPFKIGFKQDLLNRPGHFEHYFGREFKTGSSAELDFAFYTVHLKDIRSPYVDRFRRSKLKGLGSWRYYKRLYSSLHPASNLPSAYAKPLNAIFREELKRFSARLPR